MKSATYDVVIVGGGVVGATAALMLAKNTSLHIALIEANAFSTEWSPDKYDHRVSAISPAVKNIFQKLNVWELIAAKRLSSYTKMTVFDEQAVGVVDFDCENLFEPALGYIVEDSVMRTSVYAALKEYENIALLSNCKLKTIQEKIDSIALLTQSDEVIATKLLIAADGANSWVREQVQIQLKTWDYAHTAIVATVKTTLPHHQIAQQRFLSSGPLAFLPLVDSHTSSIVWSTSATHAQELLALSDADFCKVLTTAFADKLGDVVATSARYHFPLRMRHAKNYVKPRIALIGDAAHTIHPLAGQGVNLGLLDAAALVEVIMHAVTQQRDFASLHTLRRYERWRKGDNVAMLAFVEAMKFLFATEKKSLQTLRNVGMNVTNRTAFIKNFFVEYALGRRDDLPEMAR